MRMNRFLSLLGAWLLGAGLLAGAQAAPTDIAKVPLATAAPAEVLPNLMFVLDDSGSMNLDYLPDWANDRYCRASSSSSSGGGTFNAACCQTGSDITWVTNASTACWAGSSSNRRGHPPFLSSDFNSAYYNPKIRYRPPVDSTGASLPSQTATETGTWSSVKNDAYGIQNSGSINLLTEFPDTEWCTDTAYTDCLRNGNYVLPGDVGGKPYTEFHATVAWGSGLLAVGSPDAPTIETGHTWGPHYYTIDPAEYCDAPDLRNCQATKTSTFKYPAPVRWCKTDANARALTPPTNACQAVQTSSYKYARYPTKIFASSSGFPGRFTRVDIVSGKTYPKAAARTDCAGATCTYEEEMTNFANWWTYYRTRMQSMKTSASRAFSGVSDRFRVGYLSINNATKSDFLNLSRFDASAKSQWFSKLTKAKPNGSTPLRGALTQAGRLYAGKYNGSKLNGTNVVDPMQYACQRNFTLLSTDGYWTAETPRQIDGSTEIGDQDGALPRPYLDAHAASNTLADVAAYYYNTDLRNATLNNCSGADGADVCENTPQADGTTEPQRMSTFTLGLGVSGYMQFSPTYATDPQGDYFDVANGSSADPDNGICPWMATGQACTWPKPAANAQTAVDDLWHAAVNGHGTYFSASDPATLYTGLKTALNTITAMPGAAAAATTSTANMKPGDNFAFGSSYKTQEWSGDLIRRQVDTGTGTLSATTDWSAQAKLDAKASRTIYLRDPSVGTTRLKAFTWSNLTAAEAAWFESPHIDGLSQFCEFVDANCLSATSQAAAAGQPLVDFLRGDRSHEGDASDTAKFYRARTHVLGDIVNSEAVYVKEALFDYADTGYASFKSSVSARDGMIYVGANDGMLHAFDADTGEEAWAYVPSMVLPRLYKLADKEYAHEFFVDGSPTVADVYIGSAWRTVLVGGLGLGGSGYYALDVTDPANPRSLWEFTDANLGVSVGRPEVAKLKDGTWVVLVASGYNNIGDGHGRLYVLDAATGALIRSIDTGVGSTSNPSGLAHIRAWVDSTEIDNTALRVYGGDLLGNVWRFDINGDIGTAGYDAQLLATLRGGAGNAQPVTTRPEIGSVAGHALVFVGTGRYLGASDLSDSSGQSIYAIKDSLGSTGFGNPRADVKFVKQTLTDGTCPSGSDFCTAGQAIRTGSTNPVNFADDHGWYVDLPATRERANTDPTLRRGTLAITTNVIDPTPCVPGGSSFINYFDYRTGAPVSTAAGILSVKLGDALASRAVLVGLPNGKVISLTQMADGKTAAGPVPIGAGGPGTRRLSWRELVTEQ